MLRKKKIVYDDNNSLSSTNERLCINRKSLNIDNYIRFIERSKNNLKYSTFYKINEVEILRILTQCLECLKNPIELKFYKIKFTSQYITNILKCIKKLDIF